jgi:hypothetical protein
MSSKAVQIAAGSATVLGQYDDGLGTLYNMDLGATPNHVQHNGIGRTGVRFETGSAGLGTIVKSVLIRYRKYGAPTGNITVNIRKASDDTVAATIGTWSITALGEAAATEQQVVLRNRFATTYQMVANDIVSIEFPSNATNGFEISTNSVAADPSGYTSRSHNGSVWSSALTDPLSIVIKG